MPVSLTAKREWTARRAGIMLEPGDACSLQHAIWLRAGLIEGAQEEPGKVGVTGARPENEPSNIGYDP